MLKPLAWLIISSKLFFLFCVSGMGMSVSFAEDQPKPCHEKKAVSLEDCSHCAAALAAWETPGLHTSTVVLTETVVTIHGLYLLPKRQVAIKPRQNLVYSYRAPPRVVIKNAYHQPTATTELLF